MPFRSGATDHALGVVGVPRIIGGDERGARDPVSEVAIGVDRQPDSIDSALGSRDDANGRPLEVDRHRQAHGLGGEAVQALA